MRNIHRPGGIVEVTTMRQYDIINRSLDSLTSSELDSTDKNRIENLLTQMKMLLLAFSQEEMPEAFRLQNFDELFNHVKRVCHPGVPVDGVKGLVEHIGRMHTVMTEYVFDHV